MRPLIKFEINLSSGWSDVNRTKLSGYIGVHRVCTSIWGGGGGVSEGCADLLGVKHRGSVHLKNSIHPWLCFMAYKFFISRYVCLVGHWR